MPWHWEAMKDILGFSIKPDESFTLRKATEEMKLLEKVDSIVKICDNASKEYGIETALDKMEAAWADVNLDLSDYKATGTYVLKGVDEIFQLLDDHIVMTQSMSFSPFKKPFEEAIAIEYKDDVVVKVVGKSLDAEILRDMLVGVDAHLHELGCGFNPKYPRFKAYPAGSNAPGADARDGFQDRGPPGLRRGDLRSGRSAFDF
jgi:hypothetical protein